MIPYGRWRSVAQRWVFRKDPCMPFNFCNIYFCVVDTECGVEALFRRPHVFRQRVFSWERSSLFTASATENLCRREFSHSDEERWSRQNVCATCTVNVTHGLLNFIRLSLFIFCIDLNTVYSVLCECSKVWYTVGRVEIYMFHDCDRRGVLSGCKSWLNFCFSACHYFCNGSKVFIRLFATR